MASLSKFLANGKQRGVNNEALYNYLSNFVKVSGRDVSSTHLLTIIQNSRAEKKPAPEWFYPTDRTTKPGKNGILLLVENYSN